MSSPKSRPNLAGAPHGAYRRIMSKPLRCRVAWHAWHTVYDEDREPILECYRCGKREAPSTNVMARIGWPGRGDS